MNFSLKDSLYLDEFEVRKRKNQLFGDKEHSKTFDILVAEKVTKNEKFDLFNKSVCKNKKSEKTTAAQLCNFEAENPVSNFTLASVDTAKKVQKPAKSKNKAKKELKKLKKKREKFNEKLGCFFEEREIVPGALMAELMNKSENIIVYDNDLMIYNNITGCFELCKRDEFSVKLNSILSKEVRLRVKSSEYSETFRQLKISDELCHEEVFFQNGPLVNCLNGVVDVLTGKMLPHDPKHHFKHCINANYIPGANCPKYLKYLHQLFDGDEELIDLIQVVQGYICSHYNNAKTAFLIYGEPHTGKSVFNRVIERIIGNKFVTYADLSLLCKQEYAASLSGKLLNIAPDLKNLPLRDVGFFKSLVSHDDTIFARALYSNPGKVRGETKMLFTSNHFIEFDQTVGEDDVKAVFNRLLYLPVQCKPIDESEENKHLSDELFAERDAIFTWGIDGLKKYIERGERFPKSTLSEQIKKINIARYCPEKIFFDNFIEKAEGEFESVSTIKEAYAQFCVNVKAQKKNNICRYIEETLNIKKMKKRMRGISASCNSDNPIHVYPDIRLNKSY